jgi:F-type H+-transporting ATPase subunit b
MEINVGVLVAQLINFALILFLFKKFVGDNITKAIIARRAELAKAEDATKVYEETLAKAEEEKKVLIEEGLAHKNKLIEETKQSANQKAEGILAAAEKSAGHIASQAESKAAKLEAELKNGFVDGVKKTAHVVVKKLFEKDVALQEAYLDELVQEFAK